MPCSSGEPSLGRKVSRGQTPGRRCRWDSSCHLRPGDSCSPGMVSLSPMGPHLMLHQHPSALSRLGSRPLRRKPLLPAVLPHWSISRKQLLPLPSGLALLHPEPTPHPDTGPHWFSWQRGPSWKPEPTQATPPKVHELPAPLSPHGQEHLRGCWGTIPRVPPRCSSPEGVSSGTMAGNMPGGPGVPPGSCKPPARWALPLPGDGCLPQLHCPCWCSIAHILARTHSHARTYSVTNHTQ